MDDRNDAIASQAQEDFKNTAKRAAQPVKALARRGTRAIKAKAGNMVKKAGKKIAKMAAKVIKELVKNIVQCIAKLLAMLGPVGIGILIFLIIVGALWSTSFDQRGSAGDIAMDSQSENAVVQNEDGVMEVAAFSEPQALIDAYYKYLSCASQIKTFVKDDGSCKQLSFFDSDQAVDYSQLMDIGGLEKDYYLSPYFIKMTDEIVHNKEFYYPEQIIKPVFSKACTVEGDTSGKKYVTALPIIDDGSENAKHMLAGEEPHAVKENSPNEGKRRVYNDGATGQLLATSTPYTPQTSSSVETLQPNDSATKVPGIWNYGFGSIMQYEAMEKDKSITIDSISFPVHYHKSVTGSEDTCYDTINVNVYPGDTLESVKERINALSSEEAISEDTEGEGEITEKIYPVSYPSDAEITYMLGHFNFSHLQVTQDDEKWASYVYDDPDLNDAFGNGAIASDGVSVVPKSNYPLKIPVIVSAATFSGNVRFEREMQTSSEVLATKKGSQGSFEGNWNENCTQITYANNGCEDFDGKNIVTRSGTITTTQPSSSVKEIKDPTGFAYLQAYEDHYKVYVPNTVSSDLDFQKRVYNEIEGDYKTELDMDKDNKITVMDMLLKMGLLKRTEKGYVAGEDSGTVEGGEKSSEPGWEGLRSQGEATEAGKAELEKMGLSENEEDTVELIARCVMCEGGGTSKLNQLLIANVIMNRIYSTDYYAYGFSAIDILRANSQYACYASLPNTTPSEQCISSVRQAMNGELRVPSNIYGQAAANWSDGVFAVFDTSPYKTVYSYSGSELSDVDRYGRPAMTLDEMIERAKELEEEDEANGITSATASPELPDASIDSDSDTVSSAYLAKDKKYYAINSFNPHRIVQFMNKQVSRDGRAQSFIQKMFSATGSFFEKFNLFNKELEKAKIFTANADFYVPYVRCVPITDMKDTVIQAATFQERESYTSVNGAFNSEILQFIFVGPDAWGKMEYSSSTSAPKKVPGVKSVFDGFSSPTARYYQAASPWSSSQGYAAVAAPAGTKILSCGPSEVESVSSETGGYKVVMTAVTQDGKNLVITYSGLENANVTEGMSLSKGDTVGVAGDDGYNFSLQVDGVDVDPYRFFYGIDGGGSSQLVTTALAEVGTVGGAKYWRYWPYGGDPWCAAFVCWCANECGYIAQGIYPDSPSCDIMINEFKSHSQWQDKSGYEPQSGDSIFFNWNGDSRCDHVGLVKYVEDGRVYTVEGNCKVNNVSCVTELSYDLSDSHIIGYGVLP